MRRNDGFYLEHILAAADAMHLYHGGLSFDLFADTDVVRRAVLQRLGEMGEAASRLSPEFRERHADVPWADAIAFRELAVEAAFASDWYPVWITATRHAPALAKRVADLLDPADVDPDAGPD